MIVYWTDTSHGRYVLKCRLLVDVVIAIKGLSDEEILARLARYEEEEEDQDLVRLLRQQWRVEKTGGTVKGIGEHVDEAEPYEELPAPAKAFLKFQVHLSPSCRG